MALYNRISGWMIDVLWSTPTFAVLVGLGLLYTVWSKFIQFRALTHGVQAVRGKYDDKADPGAINHFQALSAALSGTVGLGNIGGVALAIGLGGPGALFWMWMTGFFGMAIKAVEVTLTMMYRDTTDPDNPHGGAMYVITRGWGDRVGGAARPFAYAVAAIFCVTLLIATFTGGNMFQAWNVGDVTNQYFGVPPLGSGVVLAAITAAVIIGGIKRIGDVAGVLVPFMCLLYLAAGVVVLVVEAANVPRLLGRIVEEAFTPSKAGGAFLGATAWYGMTTGLRRALFSNEAGQGTSPIAHSAAKTDEPVREGVVAGLEPFIDTCIVCTLTALVILATDTWNRPPAGPIAGEVRLVKQPPTPDDRSIGVTRWKVEGPSDVAALPVLPAPDAWLVGNGFYLLARVPDGRHHARGTDLVRIKGEIVKADDASRGIAWEDVALKHGEWDRPPSELALVDDGVYRDLIGAAMTGLAFDRAVPSLGKYLVTIACWLFAVSTLISWSYYGEQAMIFLFGSWSVPWYKVLYCAATVVVTLPDFIRTDKQLGDLSDLGTGVMLFANVPIILLLGHRAIAAFRDYFARLDSGRMESHTAPRLIDVIDGDDVEGTGAVGGTPRDNP